VSIDVWDLSGVIIKAILYASTLAAAGGVMFLSYGDPLLEPIDRAAVRRLVRIFLVVSLIVSALRIFVIAGSMSGDALGMLDASLVSMVWHGGEGRAIVVRVAGLLLAMPTVMRNRAPGVFALIGGAGAATSFAWLGHTHTTASDWPIALMGMHLLGTAFWLGALGPLLLLARRDDPRRVASAAARFGTTALGAVAALIVAGLGVLWILLGRISELWTSAYGRALCAKLALVACLLALGAFNKLRLTPRLSAGDVDAVRSLRNSIEVEIVLAALILILTAAFTTLAGPPRLK
jgi:copper resistance protein D